MQFHRRAPLALIDNMFCDLPHLCANIQLPKKHALSVVRTAVAILRSRTRPSLSSGFKLGATVSQSDFEGTEPASASDVRCYARKLFQAEVDLKRPDAYINLATACMLMALEEEAAVEEDVLHSSSSELAWLKALTSNIRQQDELEDVELSLVNRGVGTASSWSLSRLDALADEVKTCFLAQQMPQSVNTIASSHSTGSASEDAALRDRQASNSKAGSSTESQQDVFIKRVWQPLLAWAVGKVREVKQKPPHLKQQVPEGEAPTLDPVLLAMQQYPMQTVAAINTVLFDRHGYNCMQLHGNPRDAQLSSVLDDGAGTPTALAVLYMEVARRLGSPMVAQLLEGGRQCMIWPEHGGLSAQGEAFVIDPYSQGALYSQAEVAELFDLDLSPSGLQAASRREILAAMLAAVRDSYWCKAVGCHPEPALMAPLDVQAAASGKVQPMEGFDIRRALAAADKRLILLPEAREVQLEHALLLYFASQHADAVEELEQYKKGCVGTDGDQVNVLSCKIRYLVSEKTGW